MSSSEAEKKDTPIISQRIEDQPIQPVNILISGGRKYRFIHVARPIYMPISAGGERVEYSTRRQWEDAHQSSGITAIQ